MLGQVRRCCAAAIAVSLIAASAGALAAAPVANYLATAQSAPAAPVSPWLTLSAMTSTSSSASTAAATAAQQQSAMGPPPVAPLAVVLSTFALTVWTLIEDHEGGIYPEPISP